jgi:pimeloyl-ACP methyl ester carboxylesterase
MQLRIWLWGFALLWAFAIHDSAQAYTSGSIELNLLYIHGVKNTASSRPNAQHSLDDLRNSIDADIAVQIAAYQATHPDVSITVASAAANLYTATPSALRPSDSQDPALMDDWEVGDPGCTTTRQGDPCTTAYEWRYRLVQEINRLYPNKKNIILIGHSTGGRTAFEVASNTGPDGAGTFDWGVRDRIAGVVSINGMIDALQPNRYNVIGAASFVTTCKNGEYAGNVSGVASADWVGQNKRSLALISWGSCSPSLWTGENDGSLPFAAQGSPLSRGLNMTPASGQTYTVAYGIKYGSFCHSTITNAGAANHAAAVASAKANIYEFLFTRAHRVTTQGSNATPAAVAFNASSPTFGVGATCPAGETTRGLQVVGLCRHPGFFDGDDHIIASSEFAVTDGASCAGTYKWTQAHDSNKHNAAFYWQERASLTEGGLVTVLKPD